MCVALSWVKPFGKRGCKFTSFSANNPHPDKFFFMYAMSFRSYGHKMQNEVTNSGMPAPRYSTL